MKIKILIPKHRQSKHTTQPGMEPFYQSFISLLYSHYKGHQATLLPTNVYFVCKAKWREALNDNPNNSCVGLETSISWTHFCLLSNVSKKNVFR